MSSLQVRLTPLQAYQQALDAGFKADHAQANAVQHLENCFQNLCANQPQVQGVYLHGPVGRGKTWLMDRFYESLTVPAWRQHFHHFMKWVHKRLFQLTGQENPLTVLAQELAAEVRVLCFDELFVNDIGDATLISGLVQELFNQGLVLVATSNQHPDELYENGFNRERLLPAIAAMKESMVVVNVDGGQDHRLHPGEQLQRYWVKSPGALEQVFEQLTKEEKTEEQCHFMLAHREIKILKRSGKVLWCDYDALCEQPLAAADFITLCDEFEVILLDNVPKLTGTSRQTAIARGTEDAALQVAAGDRVLPTLSRQDDGVRRFIALVDECYDRNIPIYMNAAVPLAELYTEGALAFPFRRTLSRLQEMQLTRFKH